MAGLVVFLAIISLGRPLTILAKCLLRTCGGWAALVLLQPIAPSLGIALGVNLFNAVTLGFLGLPGFALLMLLQWYLPQTL